MGKLVRKVDFFSQFFCLSFEKVVKVGMGL